MGMSGKMEIDNKLIVGDSKDSLKSIGDNTIDSCITDPPYGIGMDHWDNNVPSVEIWGRSISHLEARRVLLEF